tara:strand:- start:84 stop:464 length:381 start_codon:yes stop_codon:yes gene_type:complete
MKERLRPTGVVNTGNNVSGNKGLRLGKRYNVAVGKTKKFITKKQIKHGAQFQKYAGPTVKLGKTVGAGVMGAGKLALRAGALGIPGLVATGAYLGGKKLAKTIAKRDRGLEWASYRQYNKKGRKII